MLLSLVVPCYNEEESVLLFYEEILRVLTDIDFEIIYINDGSKDDTLKNLKMLVNKDSRVKYISFSRNFGKESALYAGFKYSKGDLVCVIDVDLQHPPNLIPCMLDYVLNEGYDVAAARRVSRDGEPRINSFFSNLFYKIFSKISDLELVNGATDFRVMTRQVVDSVLSLQEYNRFSKGLFQWVGFETKWIPYENVERIAGDSNWSFFGLISYSIEALVSFTSAPLSMATIFGLLFSGVAFIYILIILTKNILFSDPVQGYASMMCTILFLGGLMLFTIGILGKYLEKTFLETKNRPLFIIKESNIDLD